MEDETKKPVEGENPEAAKEVATPAPQENAGEIDYKAELEKVQAQLKKAEFTLYKKNKEEKDFNSVAPELGKIVEEKLSEAQEKVQTAMVADNIEAELEKFADNQDKQALIRYHYENTVKHTGYSRKDIQRDLETAAYLADRARIERNLQEIEKSIKSKNSQSAGGSVSGVKEAEAPELNLTAKDKALMKRHGLTEKDIINNK